MRKSVRILALILALLFVLALLYGVVGSIAMAQTGIISYGSTISGKSITDTVYIRKTPNASSESGNLVVKLNGVRGEDFTFTAENGSFYFTKYGSYEGYVRKKDFSVMETPVPGEKGEWKSLGDASNVSTPAPALDVSPTPQPTRQIEQQSTTTVSSASSASGEYAKAIGGEGDIWGRISIPGGSSHYIYCNARNKDNTDFYYNKDYRHIFAMTPKDAQVSVIMGHNMRKSASMFHSLHHVQNAWLGKASCEKCGKSCGESCKSSIFNIDYNGAKQWELVCFYETEKSEPASTLSYNALSTGDAGSYASTQLSRASSNSKGKVLSSAGSGDKLMMLITCGDMIGGATGARLYMLLKAVG